MIKVLILGVNGYLASEIAVSLVSKDVDIVGVGRNREPHLDGIKYYCENLYETATLPTWIKQKYDVVIDTVSLVAPNSYGDLGEKELERLENFNFFVRKLKTKKYIFISSGGTIYGDSSVCCNEDSELSPQSLYAKMKVKQEEIILRSLPESYILRLSNPYGGSQKVKDNVGFVSHVVKSCISDNEVKINVPDSTIRDYLYIDDFLAFVHVFLFKEIEFGIYNISSGKGVKLKEVLNITEKVFGKEITVVNELCYNKSSHILKNTLENQKAIKATGYRPKFDLYDGLRAMQLGEKLD